MDIKINKEIRKYKEKIYFNLTLRQLVSVVLGLGVAIPVFFFGREYIGDDAIAWIVILIVIPVFAIGFIEINGMNFEKLMMQILKFEFIKSKKRIYVTENIYKSLDLVEEKRDKNKE